MKARYVLGMLVVMFLITSLIFSGNVSAVQANGGTPVDPDQLITSTEKVNDYYTIQHLTLANGKKLEKAIINGPSKRPAGIEAESAVVINPQAAGAVILTEVPTFNWVMGCSAVSASMIAGYYDRTGYSNIYTGPTNGGVYPLVEDAAWGTWTDSEPSTYPNNPLIASHYGLDGRTIKGSIDDYWVKYGSTAKDPYITGAWTQHTWGDAIGDYMKTSQSAYGNTDGSTSFYGYSNATKLTCAAMLSGGVSTKDGTYGRKLFYEARGYTVTDCYAQATDNRYTGGYSLASFKAEIDAGRPVFINLAGHSIVGVGYDPSSTTIYIHDTWDNSNHTMTWGGSYSGLAMQSVSIVNLATVTPPVPPEAPTNVSATDGTYSDRVQVSWTASSGATSYSVYRSATDDSGSAALLGSVTASPFNDTTAVDGTTYWYFVTASNTAGSSGFSSSDSGYRAVLPAPGAFNKTSPANGATNQSTHLTLRWGASSGATAYYYCYDTTNDGACSTWKSAGTATSVTLNLSRRTTYYWQVRAINNAGTTYANGALTAFWSFRTK